MTGHMPDYAMLMIGSNAGIVGTTREHFSIALNLRIPVLAVVTKIDMCPENILAQTMKMVDKLMKSGGAGKFPVVIKNMDDVVHAARNFASGTLCPIFQVSNVSGINLHLLRAFLNLIPLHRGNAENDPAEFQIDETFSVCFKFLKALFMYIFLGRRRRYSSQWNLYRRQNYCWR